MFILLPCMWCTYPQSSGTMSLLVGYQTSWIWAPCFECQTLLLNVGGAEGTLEWQTQIQIDSMYSFRAALLSSGKSRSRRLQEQVPEDQWSLINKYDVGEFESVSRRNYDHNQNNQYNMSHLIGLTVSNWIQKNMFGTSICQERRGCAWTQQWISDRKINDCTTKHKKPVSARSYILMHRTHSITWTWYIKCEYRFPAVRFQLVRKDDWQWIYRRKHDENVVIICALFGRLVWYFPIVVLPLAHGMLFSSVFVSEVG
jgi:hypothetical protein